MKRLFYLLLLLTMTISAIAKGDKPMTYDITGAGSGNEGMVLVKVLKFRK